MESLKRLIGGLVVVSAVILAVLVAGQPAASRAHVGGFAQRAVLLHADADAHAPPRPRPARTPDAAARRRRPRRTPTPHAARRRRHAGTPTPTRHAATPTPTPPRRTRPSPAHGHAGQHAGPPGSTPGARPSPGQHARPRRTATPAQHAGHHAGQHAAQHAGRDTPHRQRSTNRAGQRYECGPPVGRAVPGVGVHVTRPEGPPPCPVGERASAGGSRIVARPPLGGDPPPVRRKVGIARAGTAR